MKAVIRLATPTTLVMLIAATSNVLYTYYVSRLGNDSIAAVSLVLPISLIAITAMGGGIGAGASSAIARALGRKHRDDAAAIAEHAMLLSLCIGLGFAAAIWLGAERLFTLMGGRGVILEQATLFAKVLFGGSMISFAAAMLDSIMRGEGNVRIPAIWSSAALGLQILVTPLFMFGFGWGLPGAAAAMLACQSIAIVPRAFYVFGGGGVVHPHVMPQRWGPGALIEILRVGVPASLSTLINYLGLMVLTGVVARLGDSHLAAYGLGTRVDFLLMSLAYGFGVAVLTLVGLSTGARQRHRTKVYVLRAGSINASFLAIFSIVLFEWPEVWLRLFTQDAEVLAVGANYFRWIAPSYPFMGIAMVISFAFQGLGRATIPLLWMVVRVVGVVLTSLVAVAWFGATDTAVFAIVAGGNILSAGIMTLLFLWLGPRTAQ